jgi:hypothetical protein
LCAIDTINLAERSKSNTPPTATPKNSSSFVVSLTLKTCFGNPTAENGNIDDLTSLVYGLPLEDDGC